MQRLNEILAKLYVSGSLSRNDEKEEKSHDSVLRPNQVNYTSDATRACFRCSSCGSDTAIPNDILYAGQCRACSGPSDRNKAVEEMRINLQTQLSNIDMRVDAAIKCLHSDWKKSLQSPHAVKLATMIQTLDDQMAALQIKIVSMQREIANLRATITVIKADKAKLKEQQPREEELQRLIQQQQAVRDQAIYDMKQAARGRMRKILNVAFKPLNEMIYREPIHNEIFASTKGMYIYIYIYIYFLKFLTFLIL